MKAVQEMCLQAIHWLSKLQTILVQAYLLLNPILFPDKYNSLHRLSNLISYGAHPSLCVWVWSSVLKDKICVIYISIKIMEVAIMQLEV